MSNDLEQIIYICIYIAYLYIIFSEVPNMFSYWFVGTYNLSGGWYFIVIIIVNFHSNWCLAFNSFIEEIYLLYDLPFFFLKKIYLFESQL